MKKISKSDARQLLKEAGFAFDRTNKHEVWKNPATGKSFPLPTHREISPGVVRDLKKFIGK